MFRAEGGFVIGVEAEGASRIDRVAVEDTLVVLARDCTGLTTFSFDETNDRSTKAYRSSRPRRSFRAGWSLIALLAFLRFPASSEP